MKIKIKSIVAVLSLLASPLSIAASGNVLIPHFNTDGQSEMYSFFYLSNITDQPVDISVTFYDKSGNVLRDDNSASTGPIKAFDALNYQEPTSGPSITMTIDPNSTGSIKLQPNFDTVGYGKIEWVQSNTNRRKALIAHGRMWRNLSGNESSHSIVVNNGMEF